MTFKRARSGFSLFFLFVTERVRYNADAVKTNKKKQKKIEIKKQNGGH